MRLETWSIGSLYSHCHKQERLSNGWGKNGVLGAMQVILFTIICNKKKRKVCTSCDYLTHLKTTVWSALRLHYWMFTVATWEAMQTFKCKLKYLFKFYPLKTATFTNFKVKIFTLQSFIIFSLPLYRRGERERVRHTAAQLTVGKAEKR